MAAKNGTYSNPFAADFTKFLGAFPAPQFDLNAVTALQQSNIETLGEVSKVAAGGLQAMALRQTEMAREAFDAASTSAHKLSTVKPDDRLDASTNAARTAFDTGLANFQELADIAVKSQTAAFEMLGSAWSKNVDELQAAKPANK